MLEAPAVAGRLARRSLPRPLSALRGRPELPALVSVAAALNLWDLSINGWANTYYSAAVRSMASSWHDFLFASLDRAGLMTVDKPPLSVWVQALSARIFGFDQLSVLVPQALMGVAATVAVYDLVRRRFGRAAGAIAGLVFALTPIQVAISRHNNPDELLILCCVAALWLSDRALDDGRTRWLLACGAAVGLGFEAKMGVALMVVPGVAAAYVWVAPRGRIAAIRQLAAGGAVMAAVALAWPLLVTLTPAADRPWISGTADNSIWSLIFNYNGLGRIAGQAGGPGSVVGGVFGGPAGPLRLLGSGVGGQAGWLLGFAAVAGIGIAASSRLRRADARTGWVLAVGGAFAVSAIVFSIARGIFHPYYVSFLAPFAAALVGAGTGEALRGGRGARVLASAAIAAGAASELYVLGGLDGSLSWAQPLVIVVGAVAAVALALSLSPTPRAAVLGTAFAALLAAPATWAAETLGHATSSTFPSGGPPSASIGGPGLGGSSQARRGLGRFGSLGTRGRLAGSFSPFGAGGPLGGPAAFPGGAPFGGGPFSRPGTRLRGRGGGGPGGPFAGDTTGLNEAIAYARGHGGGTIGIESQSGAAHWILSSNADVAGLGGFSGRESSVTARWIATEVRDRRLTWLLGGTATRSPAAPGDGRQGSRAAIAAAERAARRIMLSDGVTLYDLRGRAAAILAAAGSA